MLSYLLAVAFWGLFAAGVIAVVKLVQLTVRYIVDYAKEKLRNNNSNKVMITQTKDLFKEKMKTADHTTLSQLEDLVEDCPVVTAVYNEESDEIEDIKAIQTDDVEYKLKSAMNNAKDGMLVIDN